MRASDAQYAKVPFHDRTETIRLPHGTDILSIAPAAPLADPARAIAKALRAPIAVPALLEIARAKGERATACIVVSDHTRPVPYRGESGILLPILRTLLDAGLQRENITILIACGTHAPMAPAEIEAMLGPEALSLGIEILNHDCRDASALVSRGRTARGTEARIHRRYAEADLKILTGLVESHFMAGVSGGRKSICPGIFGEAGTAVFHGPALMGDPRARDLHLAGNPVHEESLAVAQLVRPDFIANVTLDGDFRTTGVFFGALEEAHAAAAEKVQSYVGIPIDESYDLVITHGGFVAINHYQAAKAAVAASYAVKPGGSILLMADHHAAERVGSADYRRNMALLKSLGSEGYNRLLLSEEWRFLPDQWQAQMWSKVFRKIAMEELLYFAPALDAADWQDLPGFDACGLLERPCTGLSDADAIVQAGIARFLARRGFQASDIGTRCRIAYLADGPYGIPLLRGEGEIGAS